MRKVLRAAWAVQRVAAIGHVECQQEAKQVHKQPMSRWFQFDRIHNEQPLLLARQRGVFLSKTARRAAHRRESRRGADQKTASTGPAVRVDRREYASSTPISS